MVDTTTIDHIAVAVPNLEDYLAVYYDLGFRLDGIETVPSQGVRIAFLSLPEGPTRIELVVPLSDDSPVSKFLRKRGPGLHHICLRSGNLAGDMVALAERGYTWLQDHPVRGGDGACIAFLHPQSTGKVLIEFKQSAEDPK